MGLISHAAAAGLGYALARPEGRRQFIKLRDQLVELSRHPRVAQLQERGKRLAVQTASSAKDTVSDRLGSTASANSGSPTG